MTRGHNRLRAWVGCDTIGCLARVTVDRTSGTSEHDTNAAAAKARELGCVVVPSQKPLGSVPARVA